MSLAAVDTAKGKKSSRLGHGQPCYQAGVCEAEVETHVITVQLGAAWLKRTDSGPWENPIRDAYIGYACRNASFFC